MQTKSKSKPQVSDIESAGKALIYHSPPGGIQGLGSGDPSVFNPDFDVPQWVRVKSAIRYVEISRSTLYEYIAMGLVKNCSLKKKGNTKGMRLIFLPSLLTLLNIIAEKQSVKEKDEDNS